MKNKGITIENGQKGYINLKYNNLIVAKISKKQAKQLVSELFAGDGLVLQKKKRVTSKKKKTAMQREQEKELIIEAKQFSRCYTKMKKKYYKVRAIGEIREGTPEFKKCIGAVKICKRHNVSYLKFIKSQVEGLKWTGKFPELNVMPTDGAETRLLEYISSGGTEDSAPIRVTMTKEERETPLNANDRYIACICYIRAKTATLEQAIYAKECQLARVGKVAKYVEDYIDKLARVRGM